MGRGKEQERKRRRGQEMKRQGKGMEKKKKRKGRGRGKKRKGVKAEEGQRKGKRNGESICGLVGGYFLNKWVSPRYH